MKTPSLPELPFLKMMPGSRYFQFLFWTMVIGLVAVIAVVVLIRLGTVSNMELSLLDLKLRYRADKIPGGHSAPSKDIVLIGIDENTNKYIRLHPDKAGFSSLTLPREVLADIVEYLHREGAKTVIFDLEFKEPKQVDKDDPKAVDGDQRLADAIRRHGLVYAADRMDYTLGPFIDDQVQSISFQAEENRAYYTELFIYEALLRPYLTYQSDIHTRLMPMDASPLSIGIGPIYQPFTVIEPSLWQLTNSLNMQKARLAGYWPQSTMGQSPSYERPSFGDITEQAYSSLCTNSNYTRSFRRTPRFLSLLDQDRLSVHVEGDIPEHINREITHCYTYPTVEKIMEPLTSIGVPSIDYYQDAYIRSANVVYRGYKGNFYTYLGVRPALDLLNLDTFTYKPEAIILGNRAIPLIDGQRVMINWRDPRLLVEQMFRESKLDPDKNPKFRAELERVQADKNNPLLGGGHIYRLISAIDVIRLLRNEKLAPDEKGRLYNIPHHPESGMFSFKNKIVIIGNTVTDIHRTPMSNTMFGPEVVAAVLDMFLHDDMFIQKPDPFFQWSVVLFLAVGIAAAVITFENLSIGFTVGIILITLYWVLNIIVFVYMALWFDMLVPSAMMGFSLVAATLYRYYIHDQEKHHLTNVFSKYVSPQVMEQIVKNPEKAFDNLKGGKKELTVLFSDLQGFTHQFEDADPEMMVNQLNEYFDVMTEIILDHGGTYDKYMGDSIMAFFGAPTDMDNHAEMACRAAVEMQRALKYLNERWAVEGRKILSHGIGIASGEMFVGNFGSRKIKNFTVMGSNVNLGSRLEAFTRIARWPVIISERTWDLTQGIIRVRDLGRIQVKGFTDAVQVYGLESMVSNNVTSIPLTSGQANPADANAG